MKLVHMPCAKQKDGSSCGLFTVAFAIDFLLGRALFGYDAARMRQQMCEMLETGQIRSFSE